MVYDAHPCWCKHFALLCSAVSVLEGGVVCGIDYMVNRQLHCYVVGSKERWIVGYS